MIRAIPFLAMLPLVIVWFGVDESGKVTYVCVNCGRVSKYNMTFVDVPDDAWYTEYIDEAVRNGSFNGRSQAFFAPEIGMRPSRRWPRPRATLWAPGWRER